MNVALTDDQVKELVRCSQDYVYCASTYMKTIHLKRGEVPLKLWPFQERLFDHLIKNRKSIVLMPRQQSKTTIAAAYILCECMFRNNYTVLITSNKAKSANEVIRRIRNMYRSMPDWLTPKMTKDNATGLAWDNGSMVVASATTPDAGVGLSINLLYMDEMSRIPGNMIDQFFESVVPVISSGGKLIVTSTPKGDTNMFYYLWRDAYILKKEDAYAPFFSPWQEHPERDEAWVKETKALLKGDMEKWAQEFECSFLSKSDAIIDLKILDELNKYTLKPKTSRPKLLEYPDWKLYHPVRPDAEYFILVDASEGIGADNHIINVFDDRLQQVAIFANNELDSDKVAEQVYKASEYFNEAMIYIENESNGAAVVICLSRIFDIGERLARERPGRPPGFKMTASRRNMGITMARQHVANRRLKIYDDDTLKEFRVFKRKPGSAKYEAEYGCHDDRVMTIVLLCSLLDKIAMNNDQIHEALYDMDESDINFITHEDDIDDEEAPPMMSIGGPNDNSAAAEFDWV